MSYSVDSLPFGRGVIAHTLVSLDNKQYEIITFKTIEQLDNETASFWRDYLAALPYETSVYALVPHNKPLSAVELDFVEMINVNSSWRRNMELGDLYSQRTETEEDAAVEHQDVLDQMKGGELMLFTLDERRAIYGPGKTCV